MFFYSMLYYAQSLSAKFYYIDGPMEGPPDYLFKIILIGDSGVGKTSMMNRYADNTYTRDGASTIGVDFKIRTTNVKGKRVKLQIWDTAGQERFRAIISHYYRGAHGIMLVFDMLNHETFDHLKDWMEELESKNVPKSTIIKIIGNKIDDTEGIQVHMSEINEFLETYKIPSTNFHQVSVQDSVNVSESFQRLAEDLIKMAGNSELKHVSKIAFKARTTNTGGRCC